MKKIVFLAFVLVLLPLAVVVGFARPVKASGTITINADGSITPIDAPINTTDMVTYTFTGNINDSIVVERDNTIIDGAGYTVQGTGNGAGIDLSYRNNVTLKNVEVANFNYGIYLDHSSNNVLAGNTASNNNYGIWLILSSNNVLSGNTASSNTYIGIYLCASSNNVLSGNTASNNHYIGIDLEVVSNNNVLSGNTASSNNNYGIHLLDSSNNAIYHNDFIDNRIQAFVTAGYTNIWDDGYPSGGNYWSDYTGVDSDGDGIGDTHYMIEEGSRDRYPLMNPWIPGEEAPPPAEEDEEVFFWMLWWFWAIVIVGIAVFAVAVVTAGYVEKKKQ